MDKIRITISMQVRSNFRNHSKKTSFWETLWFFGEFFWKYDVYVLRLLISSNNLNTMNKGLVEYIYFHRALNSDMDNIKDCSYKNDIFDVNLSKNQCSIWDINCSDPFYLSIDWSPVYLTDSIKDIKYITLWFCRPQFRKKIYQSYIVNETDDAKIVYHFFIKKYIDGENCAQYICSWVLNRSLSWSNHSFVKTKLSDEFKNKDLPGYLSSSRNYSEYSYKDSCSEDYDPVLIFTEIFKDETMWRFWPIKNHQLGEFFIGYKMVSGEFNDFNQTQWWCPFKNSPKG